MDMTVQLDQSDIVTVRYAKITLDLSGPKRWMHDLCVCTYGFPSIIIYFIIVRSIAFKDFLEAYEDTESSYLHQIKPDSKPAFRK
jgi:hypothetical protein